MQASEWEVSKFEFLRGCADLPYAVSLIPCRYVDPVKTDREEWMTMAPGSGSERRS